MKLRDLLDDVGLGLLADILRTYCSDPDRVEFFYYKLLDMEQSSPYLEPNLAKEFADGIFSGELKGGVATAVWMLLIQYRARDGNSAVGKTASIPDLHGNLPWDTSSDTWAFFMYLYLAPRTKKDCLLRWPGDQVDKYWSYFKSERLRQYGVTHVAGKTNDEETLHLVKWG